MNERTTEKRLQNLAEQIHNIGTRLGMIDDNTETNLELGSKVNGIAFRLSSSPKGEYMSAPHPCFRGSQGFIGTTKAEADLTLSAVADVLYQVQRSLEASVPAPPKGSTFVGLLDGISKEAKAKKRAKRARAKRLAHEPNGER